MATESDGQPADREVREAAEAAGAGESEWVGESGRIGKLRGRAFELACLGAVSIALLSVLVLLLYVAMDAFRPFTADPGWHATYLASVVVPVLALGTYYYRREEPAGTVATATAGIPVLGLLLAAAFAVILSIGLVSIAALFALVLSVAAATVFVIAHARVRRGAALERLVVLVGAPTAAIFGVPPREGVQALNWMLERFGASFHPQRLVSFRELLLAVPVQPLDWIMLTAAVTFPVAAVLARIVAGRRDDERAGLAFVAGVLGLATLGAFVGPSLGVARTVWILVVTFSVAPLGAYVDRVVHRREGVAGLAFPVVLVGGVLVAGFLVRQLGFAAPASWLDWQFLTSVHSRTPVEAGFYPPIVGSVMMLVVIALASFPVGVGAALYLEEYAPRTGRAGRLVTLLEINIGNLAGVPSVVYGLLGLALFIRFLEMPAGAVIVGGLAIALLVLPIVIIASQEALRAVPDSHRQASFGMGATRWQTTRNVVLPEALPGILTGTILAVGRAIGETAPLLMIGAASSVRLAPSGFDDQLPAMPRQIFAWSRNLEPEIRHGVLAAGVVTLLVVLLVMNGAAIVLRNKYQSDH